MAREGAGGLALRLRARRAELEQAIAARVWAMADSAHRDPEYVEGLRGALAAAVEYCLSAVELEDPRRAPAPGALFVQARLAARHRVALDVVLRRYFAGYSLFADFLIEEARAGERLAAAELQRVLRNCSLLFDELIEGVTEEYMREAQRRADSLQERRAQSIRRLLDGEMIDTTELAYDFAGWHVGMVATDGGGADAIRELARALDCRLLLVRTGEHVFSAWLGARRRPSRELLDRALRSSWPAQASLAVGEPGHGLPGWRLTHRQASVALPVALRSEVPFVHYGDVALLACALRDEVLAASLRQLCLGPLGEQRDGEALRLTLRAYLERGQNVSAAAAALGVSRRTVANRLRRAEELFGRPVASASAEIQTALSLERLGSSLPG